MIITESSLSRIWSKTQESDCACISAFRGGLTKSENKARSSQLLQNLLHLGYSVTKIKGSYIEKTEDGKDIEVSEDSYFVANLGHDQRFVKNIKKLGFKYDQDSVLIVPQGGKDAYLFGTNTTGYPGKGVKEKVGSASYGKITQEYFSRVGGRAFEFKMLKESIDYEML